MKNKIIIGIIVLLAVGFGMYRLRTQKTSTPQYQTAVAEKGNLVVSISSSGQVSTANIGSVTTSATGVVKKISVKNDQTVKMGTKLVELELDQTSQQKYIQALASYQSAKNNLDSAKVSLYTLQSDMLSKWDSFKELSESDEYKDTTSANRALPEFVIPQSDWLATEAKYKNQQAVIAQAQTALNSASLSLQAASPIITAPISGKVSGLSLQIGSVLSSSSSDTSSQKIASIQTEATPTLTLNLSEVDLPKVKAGQKATITFDSLADKSYTGEVISVDTVGSVSSGVTSYPAVIRFDTQSNDVFANMTAQANIIINTKQDVLLIPSTAIQTENGQTYVRVLKNGKEEQISVETGLASSSQIEIISGLTEGDSVITSTVTATRTGQQSSGQTQSPFSSFGGARGGTATFGGGNVVRITR